MRGIRLPAECADGRVRGETRPEMRCKIGLLEVGRVWEQFRFCEEAHVYASVRADVQEYVPVAHRAQGGRLLDYLRHPQMRVVYATTVPPVVIRQQVGQTARPHSSQCDGNGADFFREKTPCMCMVVRGTCVAHSGAHCKMSDAVLQPSPRRAWSVGPLSCTGAPKPAGERAIFSFRTCKRGSGVGAPPA